MAWSPTIFIMNMMSNSVYIEVSRDLGQGKTFWITYDYAGDSNTISDIKQSDGTALHIEYDAQGRVKKLVDGEGRISTYEYQSGKTTVDQWHRGIMDLLL